jgi:hypothetical protein
LLVLLLINLRHCAGGGGGGNGGMNGGPYQSIELAGLGNSIDGWGESFEEAAEAPLTSNDQVVDDAAIADNTNTPAPTVNNDKQTTKNPNPKLNSKPAEKTEAQKQQERLNDLMNKANKSGKGNTSGNGKQGVEDGAIDKKGIFNKDGSPGEGGGEGGGGAEPAGLGGELPDMGAPEPGGAPETPPAGGETGGLTPESKQDNLNILLESDDMLTEDSFIDLSKGKNSLGLIEQELDKLLNS